MTASVVLQLAEDLGFGPWAGQTKDIKIGICCLAAKHAAFMSKSKDWSAKGQINV